MMDRAGKLKTNLSGDAAYKSFTPASLPSNPPVEVDNETAEKLVKANKQLALLEGVRGADSERQFIYIHVCPQGGADVVSDRRNAGVNIRYMLHRDFRGISVNEPFMKDMQAEILMQKRPRKIFAAQHEDGWFGHELHGAPGGAMDSSVAFLLMYGVEPDNENLQRLPFYEMLQGEEHHSLYRM